MKKLILLVGIPASGKSTLAKKLIAKGFTCLNADTIRKELWGDPMDQREPEKVFGILYQHLEECLSKDMDVVVDNTNLNKKQRKPILDRARKFGYTDIQLWLLDVPLDVCLERNEAREHKVPDHVISDLYLILNRQGRPQKTEGRLVLIRPGKDEDDFRFFFP